MGAEKGSASKGGMSNKSAATSPVVQGIKADQYAREKLGITAKVSNPNQPLSQSNISGYYSTKVSNQMYGSEYQQARNEYLASQGLGTMQKNGSFTTGVQTDKGLVFTSTANKAYEAAKAESMPLSRQMYDSQKLISSTAFAVMGALVGLPSLGMAGANYIYNKPYSSTVTLGRTNATYSNQTPSSKDSGGTEQVVADQTSTTTATTSTKANNYVAKLAGSGMNVSGSKRTFLGGTRKTIKGSLSGFA